MKCSRCEDSYFLKREGEILCCSNCTNHSTNLKGKKTVFRFNYKDVTLNFSSLKKLEESYDLKEVKQIINLLSEWVECQQNKKEKKDERNTTNGKTKKY